MPSVNEVMNALSNRQKVTIHNDLVKVDIFDNSKPMVSLANGAGYTIGSKECSHAIISEEITPIPTIDELLADLDKRSQSRGIR